MISANQVYVTSDGLQASNGAWSFKACSGVRASRGQCGIGVDSIAVPDGYPQWTIRIHLSGKYSGGVPGTGDGGSARAAGSERVRRRRFQAAGQTPGQLLAQISTRRCQALLGARFGIGESSPMACTCSIRCGAIRRLPSA